MSACDRQTDGRMDGHLAIVCSVHSIVW